jgi:hypothetical protein
LSKDDRERLSKEFCSYAVWIPRLLGLFVFAFLAAALLATRENLQSAVSLNQTEVAFSRLWWQLWFTAGVAAVYAVGVFFRRRVRRHFTKSLESDSPLLAHIPSFFFLRENWRNRRTILLSRIDVLLLAMAGVITAVFFVALIRPAVLSDWLPRAIFLPVLLGGGLLLFGEIAALSHRYATPFLLCFFVLGGVMSHSSPRPGAPAVRDFLPQRSSAH